MIDETNSSTRDPSPDTELEMQEGVALGLCPRCSTRSVQVTGSPGFCLKCAMHTSRQCSIPGCLCIIDKFTGMPLVGSPTHHEPSHAAWSAEHVRKDFLTCGAEDLSRWLFDLCAAGEDSPEYPVMVSARKVQDKLQGFLDARVEAVLRRGY